MAGACAGFVPSDMVPAIDDTLFPLEPTPDSDTDTRQRDPIGPQGLGRNVDGIRNELDPGYGYRAPDAGDAGAVDEADAG